MTANEIVEGIQETAKKVPTAGSMLEKIKYIETLKQMISDLEGEL